MATGGTFQPVGLVFPDAELWVCDFLQPRCGSAALVSNKVLDERRKTMVIVRRDGGVINGLVDNPRVSLRVWAPTDERAVEVTRLCVAWLLEHGPGSNGCISVAHLSGPLTVPPNPGEARSPLRLSLLSLRFRGVTHAQEAL